MNPKPYFPLSALHGPHPKSKHHQIMTPNRLYYVTSHVIPDPQPIPFTEIHSQPQVLSVRDGSSCARLTVNATTGALRLLTDASLLDKGVDSLIQLRFVTSVSSDHPLVFTSRDVFEGVLRHRLVPHLPGYKAGDPSRR